MPTKAKLTFRELGEGDIGIFKEIRLEALEAHPESFLGAHETEAKEPDSFFKDKIFSDKVIGCFHENGRLLGIAGYYVLTPEGKRAHSVKIWGFYVRPDYRGRGFAKKLFQAMLDEAEMVCEKALLKVNKKSRGAIKLYKSLGFTIYGLEEKSLKIGDVYHDDYLMEKIF